MNSNLKLLPAALLVAVLALAGCGGGSDSEPVDPGPTAEQQLIMDLQAEIAALRTQLGLSADGNIGETVAELQAQLKELQDAKTAADKAAADAATAAMMATAMKLYNGLEHGLGNTDNARDGASDAAGVITVTNGTITQALAEDKKAMVDALKGWAGMRHTAEPDGAGMYEAMVYSNVGDPTEGDPFNEEYTLDGTTGELAIDTSDAAVAARVASSSFDQSAGTKSFKLPANTVRVMIAGSYHGVSGTYNCTPNAETNCAATIASDGFTLGGGAWTFKPTSATDKVMSTNDTVYASYGWWLHKSEDGMTYTASAFAADRGDVTDATGITNLRGTATYSGGAAGKYALYSATGGTNDAGHFTADAMLNANFNDDTVTGTIDNFMGADGKMRDWSVELKKSTVSDGGAIAGDPATSGNTDPQMTVWTIDGTAAAASGAWSGSIQDNGDDGVPKVATGTFNSEYSPSGRMVGGFGANKQ